MNLILWRHAEAEDGMNDMQRALTARGRKQAEQMAAWLRKHAPPDLQVCVSPAIRALQTADALGCDYRIVEEIEPGAAPEDLLEVAGWPANEGSVLLVGHQPTLGRTVSLALTGVAQPWTVRKAGLWWLARRERDSVEQTVVRAVVNPEFL